jgi:hypothetical protein
VKRPAACSPPGAVEDLLTGSEYVGQLREDVVPDLHVVFGGGIPCFQADCVEGCLAADTAGRGCVEVPLDSCDGSRYAGGQAEVEDVVGVAPFVITGIAVPGVADVVDAADDAFGVQESVCQLDIVAGGAHGDGQGFAVDAEFEGFFDGERVGSGAVAVRSDPEDRAARDQPAHGRAPGSSGSNRAAIASAGPGATTANASAPAAPRSIAEPP